MLSRFRTLKTLRVSNVVRSELPSNRSNTNEKYAYAAGLLASSLLFSSAVYAYGDESKVEPAKKEELTAQQQESALEATRQEIRARVLLVLSNYLGIEASEALKLIPVMFPHLESADDFKAILARHRQAEGQVLAQDGSRAYIDHTILAANVTEKQIDQLCAEAKEHQFKAVCVEGGRIAQAKARLAGTDIKVAAVVGFPLVLGATTTQSKSSEAFEYCALGADEIDMVIDIGRIKDRDYEYVLHNVEGVVDAVSKFRWRKDAPILKVIIECCLLTREEIIDASILCYLAGAEYVKTSTGFSTHGATEEHVRLMKLTVGNDIKVKAAGGVRDKKALVSMVNQGASRIGTSSGTKLVLNANEAREEWNVLQSQSNRS